MNERLLQIALLGRPILREKAAAVENTTDPEIKTLVTDMIATMLDANMLGLAAPQVFVSKRLFVMRCRKSERNPDAPDLPPTAVINPKFSKTSDERQQGWETCGSIPGYYAYVWRTKTILASFTDLSGQETEMELNGLAARVFQHEYDHLDGITFLERIDIITDFVTVEEMRRITTGKPNA